MKNFLRMLQTRKNREAIYTQPNYWDWKAKNYNNLSISLWPNQILNTLYHQEHIRCDYNSLGKLIGKEVLDLGCGVGRMTRHLANCGAKVLGVDFSPETVAVARNLSSGDNPRYEVASLYDLDYHNRFDVVCVTGVLSVACKSRDDVARALAIIRRAARSGGVLVVIEPLHKGFLHRVLNMDQVEFCSLVQQAGLGIEWFKELHFWPMRFALAFVSWPKWVTVPCYHVGQALMRLPVLRRMGDYKAIKAFVV